MASLRCYVPWRLVFLSRPLRILLLLKGLSEVIQSVQTVKLKIGSNGSQAPYDEELTPPQMSPFPTEGEVYRYLTLTYEAIGQAYVKVAAEQDACSLSRVDGNDIDTTTGRGDGDGDDAASKGHGRPTGLRAVMEKFEESPFELHILEKALERPGIRGGVGGLIINMILLFGSTIGKDPRQTLEKAMNAFEVFERYPGLFRFIMWSHYGHFIALLFKRLDGANGREYYDRLRATFNHVRPPEFKALPPFDEWHGMESVCVKACCRDSEALLKKEFGPNDVEDTESVGLENGEDLSSCDSRSFRDPVDYRDRDVEDGIDPGLGVLGSPEMAILSATVEGERLVTPHPLWLPQKSHWNGEMKNGVERDSNNGYDYLDSIPGADGIVAEEWDEVANMLNL